jgi:hypothetical protein
MKNWINTLMILIKKSVSKINYQLMKIIDLMENLFLEWQFIIVFNIFVIVVGRIGSFEDYFVYCSLIFYWLKINDGLKFWLFVLLVSIIIVFFYYLLNDKLLFSPIYSNLIPPTRSLYFSYKFLLMLQRNWNINI